MLCNLADKLLRESQICCLQGFVAISLFPLMLSFAGRARACSFN
ncbi:hypothetical protein MtrunA17_Chr4g0028751 [Medicago truncatula]|uniref:Transmembrane protein n=1 Tax=Medicago truncatula TaxID=3880 RepID=A0A396I502_MEDTR|nr:hypothetical protein MtrunA17_Chr4g0028751 [Medicago truncatula]